MDLVGDFTSVGSESAFEQGHDAFMYNQPQEVNPYMEGTSEFDDWNTGWIRGEDGVPKTDLPTASVVSSSDPEYDKFVQGINEESQQGDSLEMIGELLSVEERDAWIAEGSPTNYAEIGKIINRVGSRVAKRKRFRVNDDGMAHVGGSNEETEVEISSDSTEVLMPESGKYIIEFKNMADLHSVYVVCKKMEWPVTVDQKKLLMQIISPLEKAKLFNFLRNSSGVEKLKVHGPIKK